MLQTRRHHAVTEWIEQLRAGVEPPANLHEQARVYFPLAIASTPAGACIVCRARLAGTQRYLCGGHWDWVQYEPLEEFELTANSRGSVIEFLEVYMLGTFVLSTQGQRLSAAKGRSHCEVCGTVTGNTESLYGRYGSVVKSHIVCPEHQTFRWEDESEKQ